MSDKEFLKGMLDGSVALETRGERVLLDALRKAEAEASEHESRANRWMVQAQHAEAELAAAIKQSLEQHRIVQDLGRELRAERAQRERLEKAVQRHLMAIGHDAADETDCDVGFGCTLCELSKALRHDAPWPCGHAKLHHEDELCRECSP